MIKEQITPSIILTLLFIAVAGICFPVVIWGIAQIVLPYQANGSLIVKDEQLVGSTLIGQSFTSPKYFHSRPSAAGAGYDPLSSSGSNLGPTSKKLFDGIPDDPKTTNVDESYPGVDARAQAYRKENGLLSDSKVPVDAVTRSSSGLDPHISLQNAKLQSARVAQARGLQTEQVEALLREISESRFLGIFGEPRVNVLKLNLALDSIGKF